MSNISQASAAERWARASHLVSVAVMQISMQPHPKGMADRDLRKPTLLERAGGQGFAQASPQRAGFPLRGYAPLTALSLP